MLSKASKPEVRTLTPRQPSSTFRSKARNTPGLPVMAIATAQRMLSVASVRGCTKGSWLPVSTTGTGMFRSI